MFVFPRSLCVDALIELSDENADWKLSFDEFLNCLKPGFNPPEKSKLLFAYFKVKKFQLDSPDTQHTVEMSFRLVLYSKFFVMVSYSVV